MENLKEQLQQLASTPELLELTILGYTVPNSSIEHTYENGIAILEAITFLPEEKQLACLKTLRANTNNYTLLNTFVINDAYKNLSAQLDSEEIIYGIDKSRLDDMGKLRESASTIKDLLKIPTANKNVISEICKEYRNRGYKLEGMNSTDLINNFTAITQLIGLDPNPEYKWEQRIQDIKEQMQYVPKNNNSLEPKFEERINVWIVKEYQKYLQENYKDNTNYILQELAKVNKELGIFCLPVYNYKLEKKYYDIEFTPEQLAKFIHDSGIETSDPRYQETINKFRNNAKKLIENKYSNSGAVQQMTSDLLVYDAMQEEIGETEYLEQGQGRGR